MASSLEVGFAKFMVGAKDRLRLYKKIAGLLSNGVSLQAALDVLWDQAAKGGKAKGAPLAIAIDQWRSAYRNGKPFGQALDGWAPLGERMLVEAGETGSRLDEALLNVIKLAESSQAIKGAIVGGLAYPGVLLLMLGGMLYLFGVQVIPSFGQLLPPEQWTGMAAGMRIMAIIANGYLVPIAIGLVVFVIVFSITAPRWTGRVRVFFDKIPPWSIYRLVQGGGFLMAIAALVTIGVSVPEVLRKLRRNSTPYLRERIDSALRYVNSGANLGDALHRGRYGFPDPVIVEDLRIYASLSSFDESLKAVANEWIETGVDQIKGQAKVLNTLAILLIGITIMTLLGGLFDLQGQITSAASGM